VLVAALSAFLLALCGAAFAVVRQAERDRLTSTALQAALALENAVRAAHPAGREELQQVFRSFEAEGIEYVAIIGGGRRVVAHSDPTQVDRFVSDPRLEDAFDSEEVVAGFTTAPDGHEVFDVFLPRKRIGMGRGRFGPGPGPWPWPGLGPGHGPGPGPGMGPGMGPGEVVARMGVGVGGSEWMWNWLRAQAAASLLVIAAMAYGLYRGRRTAAALAAAESERSRREVLAKLGEVSAVLAHEIRNPLGAMKGHVQLALEEAARGEGDGVRRRLETALAEVVRVERLVRGLLDYAADRPPERSLLALSEVVARAVELARPPAGSQGAEVRSDCDPSIEVAVDPEQLSRAVANIVRNAAEAAGDGGRVRVAATLAGREVVISVEDSGPGVPEGARDRLFDPFVTTKVRGVGLGLAVARQVVEAHGGTLTAGRSDALGGARFEVRIPGSSRPAGS